jgi:hypothetical protein
MKRDARVIFWQGPIVVSEGSAAAEMNVELFH